jgi:hypothetical protein
MPDPEEIIDAGFAALKNATPRRSTAQLLERSNRLAIRARVAKGATGFLAAAAAIVIAAVALQPQSALAALKESSRLTASQPIIHMHSESSTKYQYLTSPPWPQVPPLDVWRFPDRYVRKQGHSITVSYKAGKMLSYDDRFATGYLSSYEAAKDGFWNFDGTISIELSQPHKTPPEVRSVIKNGKTFTDYEWQDTDGFGHKTTSNILVDPESKLVRFGDDQRVDPSGDVSHGYSYVEYPTEEAAKRELPSFPQGLKFRTKDELTNEFNSTIGRPDQAKTIGGIRVTLYGVVIYPYVPDGLGVIVLARGGSGPDYGSSNPPEIVGESLLPVKRLDWVNNAADQSHVRFGSFPTINGQNYIADKTEDLMVRAPSRITIRVPVWRQDSVSDHDFVGYVTFTTSKIFCDSGDGSWNFY